jgi:hypothetical protein
MFKALLLVGLAVQALAVTNVDFDAKPRGVNLYVPEVDPQSEMRVPRKLAAVAATVADAGAFQGMADSKKYDALFSKSSCNVIDPKGTCNTDSVPAKEMYACCNERVCIAPLNRRFSCQTGVTNACCPRSSLLTIVGVPSNSDASASD